MSNTSGYVYVLSNPAMPGIVKIGRSKHSGRIRARDIYKKGGTGVPMPFKMEFEIWSQNCIESELLVHEELYQTRINPNREFFSLDVSAAIEEVMRVVGDEHLLCVGSIETTLTEDDLINYADCARDVIRQSFPGIPWQVVIAHAVGYHLDDNSIISSVKRYKESCEKQRVKSDTNKQKRKPQSC